MTAPSPSAHPRRPRHPPTPALPMNPSTTAPPPPATGLRIALLEDLPEFAEQMVGWLEAAGHRCHWKAGTVEFMRMFARESFDLVLLDWQLPDGSGDEVLGWIQRTVDAPPPVIFVTSRGEEADVAHILDLGAQDYLVKPLRQLELLARVRAVARRRGGAADDVLLEIGNLRVDTLARSVERDGEPVELGGKEFAIIVLMLRNLGRVVSREQLYEAGWGRALSGTTRTVDTHVSQVRTRLGLTMASGWRLSSIYQRGYRLERATG